MSLSPAALLAQDGWLALLSGREVVRHGLPSVDHLTVWSAGAQWVDLQWLGQLGLYGLYALGGLHFLLAADVILAIATFALAVVVARRFGGSARSTAVVALVALAPVASTIAGLRTQLLGSTLFVLALWLLAADAARPSRRVLLVLPLLVVWTNVHGSVLLGAALTILAALTTVVRERRLTGRTLLLVAGPIAALFASPYGLSLAGYYHRTLFNAEFGRVVSEWRPVRLEAGTIPVFAVVAVGLWLLGRAGSNVTLFERLAFVLVAVAAVDAERNIGWLGLTAIVVLPRLLDVAVRVREHRTDPPVRLAFCLLAALGAAVAVASLAVSPSAALAKRFPPGLKRLVAEELATHPQATVFADPQYADWLLWTVPAARGRVVFDARFELLSNARLESLYRFRNQIGDAWPAPARTSALVVVRGRDRRLTTGLARRVGPRVWTGGGAAAFRR